MSNTKYIGNELTIFSDAVNWKRYWLKAIRPYLLGDVLEVGAGIGANTKLILQENLQIKSLLSLEPDPELAKRIPEIVENETDKLTVKTIYLKDLNKDEKFDTILYIDVIEHIKDDKSEMELAKSYLKEGGHLIVLVPAYNYLFSPFDKAVGHYRRYNKKMMISSLPKEGMAKKKLFYLDSLGAFASLVNKLILKQSYPTKKQILTWDRIIIPTSKFIDVITFKKFGKSLIGVWKK